MARRAADFALALARPNRARVKVLYVSQGATRGRKPTSVSHRREEAVLKDIAGLAARYGVHVDTAIRTRATPDKAIIREVASGAAMVVKGGRPAPGRRAVFRRHRKRRSGGLQLSNCAASRRAHQAHHHHWCGAGRPLTRSSKFLRGQHCRLRRRQSPRRFAEKCPRGSSPGPMSCGMGIAGKRGGPSLAEHQEPRFLTGTPSGYQ